MVCHGDGSWGPIPDSAIPEPRKGVVDKWVKRRPYADETENELIGHVLKRHIGHIVTMIQKIADTTASQSEKDRAEIILHDIRFARELSALLEEFEKEVEPE